MIQSNDFKGYLKDNHDFIMELHHHDSILISRLQDVLKVLWYICEYADEGNQITEEQEIFFETGFSYFHEQLEMIKIYLNKYFKSDLHYLLEYERAVNYSLYLGDLSEALSEKGYLTKKAENTINNILDELESIIREKKEFEEEIFNSYDLQIESILPKNVEIHTTDFIFSLIIDELE